MEYSFNLEWNELSEDLRERKIDEFVQKSYEEEHRDVTVGEMDKILDNQEMRDKAEQRIETRFPIYF